MKFRRQRIDDGGINLTPLIDVVFLLLIFFMVSTTFTKESRLQLELPTADGNPAIEQPESLEIVIDAKGQYQINDRRLGKASMTDLMQAMQAGMTANRRDSNDSFDAIRPLRGGDVRAGP